MQSSLTPALNCYRRSWLHCASKWMVAGHRSCWLALRRDPRSLVWRGLSDRSCLSWIEIFVGAALLASLMWSPLGSFAKIQSVQNCLNPKLSSQKPLLLWSWSPTLSWCAAHKQIAKSSRSAPRASTPPHRSTPLWSVHPSTDNHQTSASLECRRSSWTPHQRPKLHLRRPPDASNCPLTALS